MNNQYKKCFEYDEQYQKGKIFEDFVTDEFLKNGIDIIMFTNFKSQWHGENLFGIEIKNDLVLTTTGNVYIEYQSYAKEHGDFVNEGILKKDNSKFYIIGNKNEYYIFYKNDLKKILKKLLNKEYINGCRLTEKKVNTKNSKGFIIENVKTRSDLWITNNIQDFILKVKPYVENYLNDIYFKYQYGGNMNKIEILGRLTKDVDVRYTQTSNTMVASFSIAVNRRFIKQGEERQADFFNVVAYGKTAEFISKYFKKGQQVVVIGRLQNRNWTDEQGQKHYITEIIAEEVYFADSKKDNTTNDVPDEEIFVPNFIDDGSDLPF